MPHTPVYQAVVAAGSEHASYEAVAHERCDLFINDWIMEEQGGYDIALAEFYADRPEAACKACTKYVGRRYRQTYGLAPFIFVAIFSGLISWFVQRTLDALFPKTEPADTDFLD